MFRGFAYLYAESGSGIKDFETVSTPRLLRLSHNRTPGFIDEFGVTTAMTRRYGRAPAGERVVATAPGAWKNVTMIVGLRPTAVVAPFVFEGATDGAAFGT
jgi:hypothetical protein